MIEVIIYNFITTIILFSCGHFFLHYITNLKTKQSSNFNIYLIYGVFFAGIIALLVNFFLPLGLMVNSTFALLFIVYFFLRIIYNKKNWKNVILYLFIFSLICSLLILFSNINRPDAGLYHLPFTKIINEYKVIFGLTNIHFRFGHTSIIQYSNAFNFNYLFKENGILIPQTIIITSVILYFFLDFLKFEKLKEINISTIFLFFCIIFSIYSYNRYSSFGNDAGGNILFIFLIYVSSKLLNKKKIKINDILNLSYLSLFCFLQKSFLIFSFLIPILFLFYFLKKNKWNIFKNKNLYLLKFIFFIFLLKNILVSGCFIYPAQVTCIKSLDWYNDITTKRESLMAEAWAKDWINQDTDKFEPDIYIKNFNWFKTWKSNHLKIILEKYLPYLLFISIFSIYFALTNKKRNLPFSSKEKFIFFVLSTTTFISLTVWFFKFPLYRYGSSILGGFSISFFSLFLNKYNKFPIKNIFKTLKIIIIIAFIIIILKNFLRIYDHLKNNELKSPWPNIYSLSKDNEVTEYKLYKKEKKIMFFLANDGLCMYGPAPCTYYVEKGIEKKNYLDYEIYFIK